MSSRMNPPMNPRQTRTGNDETLTYIYGDSPLGRLLLVRGPDGVHALLPGDDDAALMTEAQRRCGTALKADDSEEGAALLARITDALVEAPATNREPPLAPRGTPFQQRVWTELRAVPAGTTVSYTDIARRIGRPKAVRAVAQACGANPIAVLIPCHRVVRGDGGLGGYRWGLERKRELLRREGAGVPRSPADA